METIALRALDREGLEPVSGGYGYGPASRATGKARARGSRRTSFKPGQSGNPAGRPKGAKDRDAAGICVRGFPLLQPESERLPWVVPLSSPNLAIGYVSNPLKQPPTAGPALRVGPAVAGPPRGRGPAQTSKLAASYAVRRDR